MFNSVKVLKTAFILIILFLIGTPCWSFWPSIKLFNKVRNEIEAKFTGVESRIDKVETRITGIDKSIQAGRDSITNESIIFYWIISALVAIIGLMLKDRQKLRKDLLSVIKQKRTFKQGYYELKNK